MKLDDVLTDTVTIAQRPSYGAADPGVERQSISNREIVLQERAFSHILVALDGSPEAEKVLDYVGLLASQQRAAVTLLRVISPFEAARLREARVGIAPAVSADCNLIRLDIDDCLASLAAALEGLGIEVHVRCLAGQRPADTIVELAREERADLIGLTAVGKGNRSASRLGSVAEEVVRRAPCPVLLVGGENVPSAQHDAETGRQRSARGAR